MKLALILNHEQQPGEESGAGPITFHLKNGHVLFLRCPAPLNICVLESWRTVLVSWGMVHCPCTMDLYHCTQRPLSG